MLLDQKAITSAVAILLREQRDESQKAIAELMLRLETLQARIETLEREPPGKRLRAVGGEGSAA